MARFVLFLMLAIWCEGAFGRSSDGSQRSAKNEHQSIIFGLFEGGRGCIELLQNALTLSLYTAFTYSVLGLQVAFKLNAVIMVMLGISSWSRYQTKRFSNRPIGRAAQER